MIRLVVVTLIILFGQFNHHLSAQEIKNYEIERHKRGGSIKEHGNAISDFAKITLDDGSAIFTRYDKTLGRSYLLKLDKDLNEVWEKKIDVGYKYNYTEYGLFPNDKGFLVLSGLWTRQPLHVTQFDLDGNQLSDQELVINTSGRFSHDFSKLVIFNVDEERYLGELIKAKKEKFTLPYAWVDLKSGDVKKNTVDFEGKYLKIEQVGYTKNHVQFIVRHMLDKKTEGKRILYDVNINNGERTSFELNQLVSKINRKTSYVRNSERFIVYVLDDAMELLVYDREHHDVRIIKPDFPSQSYSFPEVALINDKFYTAGTTGKQVLYGYVDLTNRDKNTIDIKEYNVNSEEDIYVTSLHYLENEKIVVNIEERYDLSKTGVYTRSSFGEQYVSGTAYYFGAGDAYSLLFNGDDFSFIKSNHISREHVKATSSKDYYQEKTFSSEEIVFNANDKYMTYYHMRSDSVFIEQFDLEGNKYRSVNFYIPGKNQLKKGLQFSLSGQSWVMDDRVYLILTRAFYTASNLVLYHIN